MDGIEADTCVRFVNRKSHEDYIKISSEDGCHSRLGRVGGRQVLSLKSSGCFKYGKIQHELIHALGKKKFQGFS